MSNKKTNKRGKLAHELLGVFAAAGAITIFFFGFLSVTANALVLTYSEKNQIIFTDAQEWMIDVWVKNISFATAMLLFVVLFLIFAGQRLAYIKDIIQGIHALSAHRMEYEIPIEGNNELTELAESINALSKTEREIQRKETLMREEKEGLIRALSHDIRTPLTSMLSYSEYMLGKKDIDPELFSTYVELVKQKSEQIKSLTDRLLDGGRTLEKFENGRFLVEQLCDEWEADVEETHICEVDLSKCPEFAGEFDVQELRRIFDNLASNVRKYAEPKEPVLLEVWCAQDDLVIVQKNRRGEVAADVESSKIGLESIRKIAELYNGSVKVQEDGQEFWIEIWLKINPHL